MHMPLIMLAGSYERMGSSGTPGDPNFVGPLQSTSSKPGSTDWWELAKQAIQTGGQVASEWFKSQQAVAVTPQEQAAVYNAANMAGIPLSQNSYLPWIIGGGVLLVALIVLKKK